MDATGLLVNQTHNATGIVQAVQSNSLVFTIIGLALVLVAVFIVWRVIKNLIANAIIGGIGLIAMHFFFPVLLDLKVDISVVNIIIAVLAGLPGLVIILLLTLFGLT